jgi:hypothetical protein
MNKTVLRDAVFWNVMPCGSCKNQHFGGMYCLHHQGDSELGDTVVPNVSFNKSHMA